MITLWTTLKTRHPSDPILKLERKISLVSILSNARTIRISPVPQMVEQQLTLLFMFKSGAIRER
jgi:hypothetical protein